MLPDTLSQQTLGLSFAPGRFRLLGILVTMVLLLALGPFLPALVHAHPLTGNLRLLHDGLLLLLLLLSVLNAFDTFRRLIAARRVSEERYRWLMDNAGQAILLCPLNADGTTGPFREVNAMAVRCSGYTEEELCQRTLIDLFAPECLENLRTFIADLRVRKQNLLDIVQVTHSGKRFPVELFARVCENSLGSLIYCYLRDISDPKRVEAALREERTTLHALNAVSPLAVVALDTEEHVTRWNPAA